MPKKGNYAGINELADSVYFRPLAQAQDEKSSTGQKDASAEPVNAPISAQTLESNDPPTLPDKEPKQAETTAVQTTKQSSNQATNETTNEWSFVRSNRREKIRHTFDIYKDQLLSLRQVTLEREATLGERVLLGDVVQEALDMFITKERNKESSFERTK